MYNVPLLSNMVVAHPYVDGATTRCQRYGMSWVVTLVG